MASEVPYVEPHERMGAESSRHIARNTRGRVPAQHVLAGLCYYAQNGVCFYDDVHGTKINGLDGFKDLVDADKPFPLTFLEGMWSLAELTADFLPTACYAGTLMLQAMRWEDGCSTEWIHLQF